MVFEEKPAIDTSPEVDAAIKLLTDYELDGTKVFNYDCARKSCKLINIMNSMPRNYELCTTEIALEIVKPRRCKDPREICNYVEFTRPYIANKRFDEIKKAGKNRRNKNIRNEFTKNIYELIGSKGKEYVAEMCQYLDDLLRIINLANNTGSAEDPRFDNDLTAALHYIKHKNEFLKDNKEFTPFQYIAIAREVIQQCEPKKLANCDSSAYIDHTRRIKVIARRSDNSVIIETCHTTPS